MEKTLKTFAILITLASLPMAANADTTAPGTAAPPMTAPNDMSGMMAQGGMKMDGMQMDGMVGQMMQMMQIMEMMQMTQMMSDCTKMMANMSMMGKGADPMMTTPTAPAPKG